MADENVQRIIVSAVQRAYDAWAVEHPSLAAVIDRISMTERAVESLRQSQQFRQAVDEYHTSRGELEFLNRLMDLAGPVIASIMAG